MGKRKQTHHRKNTTTTTTTTTAAAAAAAGAGASITSKRQRLKWSSSHKKRHKQRHQKFWIQDCPDLIDPDAALFQPTSEPDRGSSVPPLSTTRQHLLVYITAAYLQDDHPKMSAGLGTHLTMPTTSATAAATPTTLTSRDDSKSFPTTRADGKDDNDHTYQRATAVVVDSTLVDSTLSSSTSSNNPPVIYIQRQRRHDATTSSSSASTNTVTKSNQSTLVGSSTKPFRHLPHGDNGDGVVNPHHDVPDKYWAQRKRLFAKFDNGIQLDADGWFSVTPEAIATHIAQRLTLNVTTPTTTTLSADAHSNLDTGTINNNNGLIVLDAFGGVGGNAIAFALCPTVDLVVCVDTCMDRLQLAAHNCRVYNVPVQKMLFVHGNACQVLECYRQGALLQTLPPNIAKTEQPLPSISSLKNAKVDASNNNDQYTFGGYYSLPPRLDVIFLSPPWGGPQYRDIGPRHFGLSNIQLLSAEATAPKDGTVDDDRNDDRTNVTNQGVNQCNDKVLSTEHGTADSGNVVDGVALLRLAVNALAADRLQIGYYLPRNLNGLTFAHDCYTACNIRGTIEMEQNVLNDKLKTITVYIRGDGR